MIDRLTDSGFFEAEEFEDSPEARVLLVLTGGVLMFGGFRLWAVLEPSSVLGGLSVVLLYAAASQLVFFAATGVDMDRWGTIVAYGVLLTLTIALVAALARVLFSRISTDAMMFSAYSAQLLLEGSNPYSTTMTGAFELSGIAAKYSTPRIDGTTVNQFSYPGGAVLWFLPQRATIGRTHFGLRLTLVLVAVATAALLIHDTPAPLALGGLVSMLAGRNMFFTAAGGVLDILWVLPVLVSMRYWYQERYWWAAVAFGLAAGTKQNPWPIAAFLAVWIWSASPTWRECGRWAATCIAGGLTGFLALNLPFIVWNPGEWLAGVATPIGGSAPMVHQGVGITLITMLGVAPVSTGWFTLAVVAVTVTLLAAYALYFDQLRWSAWVAPMLIYLVHYRSLTSYFVVFLPLAFYAVLAHYHVLEVPQSAAAPNPDSDREEDHVAPA